MTFSSVVNPSGPSLTPTTPNLSLLLLCNKKGGRYALRILGHQLGCSFAPVPCMSKKLDLTYWGKAPCLCALAAAELLIHKSKNLTFGSPTDIFSTPLQSSSSLGGT